MEITERKYQLEEWTIEQIEKYAIKLDEISPVMVWTAYATKSEIDNNLCLEGENISLHAYDFKNGKHHYLKHYFDPTMRKRTDEVKELFGEDAIFYGPKSVNSEYTYKLNIKKVDGGAIMVQTISFKLKKPFKKDYGVTRSFGTGQGYNSGDYIYFLLPDKTYIKVQNYIYKCFRNIYVYLPEEGSVYTEDFNRDFNYNNENPGPHGETFAEMMMGVTGKEIPRYHILSGTQLVDITRMWTWKDIMRYKEVEVKNTKKQRDLGEINKLIIKDTPIGESRLLSQDPNLNKYSWARVPDEAYIEKVNDETVVVRYFAIGNICDKEVKEEILRLYVLKDKFIGSKKRFDGQWVVVNATKYARNWCAEKFFIQKDIFNKPMKNPIYYARDIINGKDNEDLSVNMGSFICNLLKYPILESILKLNIKIGAAGYTDNLMVGLEHLVGPIDSNERNPYKAMGVNANQVKALGNKLDTSFIGDIKTIIHNESVETRYYYSKPRFKEYASISDIDAETFKDYVNKLKKLSRCITNMVYLNSYREEYERERPITSTETKVMRLLVRAAKVYGYHTAMSDAFTEMIVNLSNGYIAYNSKTRTEEVERYFGDPTELYMDYLGMAEIVDDKRMAPAIFKTYKELKDAHDSLIIIANNKKHEHEQEKFNKMKKDWEKYVFENDKYQVIYPETPGEIVAEGRSLHHCVASFVTAVANGQTNILFLREKEKPKDSLLTIEVLGDTVRQAHGFANCNLSGMEDNYPGINKFFNDWAKSNKLKADHINSLLCVQ